MNKLSSLTKGQRQKEAIATSISESVGRALKRANDRCRTRIFFLNFSLNFTQWDCEILIARFEGLWLILWMEFKPARPKFRRHSVGETSSTVCVKAIKTTGFRMLLYVNSL